MSEPLHLPDVTLVAVDTATHDLTRLALEECTNKVEFGNIIVFSDRHILPGSEWHLIEPVRDVEEAVRHYWYSIPQVVTTSHFLVIQWDSWVLDTDSWEPEFLDYDYIGAPWWRTGEAHNVGNGGFSLRSVNMTRRVASDPQSYPFSEPEDDILCRRYGSALEAEGFKFAPTHKALRFSRERLRAVDVDGYTFPTFGFHGQFNWPSVLSDDEIAERLTYATPAVFNHIHFAQMCAELTEHGRRVPPKPITKSAVYGSAA